MLAATISDEPPTMTEDVHALGASSAPPTTVAPPEAPGAPPQRFAYAPAPAVPAPAAPAPFVPPPLPPGKGKGKTLTPPDLTPPGLTPPMDLMMAMIAHMTQLEGQLARMERLEGQLEREIATLRFTVNALRERNSASGSGSGFEVLGHTEQVINLDENWQSTSSTAAGDDSGAAESNGDQS